MKRRLFGTNKAVEDKIANLNRIDVFDDGWSEVYLDPETNEKWLKYVIDPDRGNFYHLVLFEPKLSKNDLIQVALQSEHKDEVAAAGKRLFLTENFLFYSYELLDGIEQKIHAGDLDENRKECIKNLIISAQLNNRVNNNTILKNSKEVVDAEYSLQSEIADRAESILNSL